MALGDHAVHRHLAPGLHAQDVAHPDGVQCHLSQAGGFSDAIQGPAWSDDSGWGDYDNYSTIRFADIDADGDADLCGRANAGIRCYRWTGEAFAVGSAEIPDGLKKQLDVFADVLKGKKGSGRQVRVIGHADASGSAEANQALSLRRAESVKTYLVSKGADPAMLVAVGVGASEPKNAANPAAPENRRVEIGREQPPKQ